MSSKYTQTPRPTQSHLHTQTNLHRDITCTPTRRHHTASCLRSIQWSQVAAPVMVSGIIMHSHSCRAPEFQFTIQMMYC